MDDPNKEFNDPERLFGQARCGRSQLSEVLQQRILADADRVQAGFARRSGPAAKPGGTPGFGGRMLAGLGGWPAMGGLATACAAGVWIGLAPPAFLPDPAQLLMASGSEIDLMGMDGLAFALIEER